MVNVLKDAFGPDKDDDLEDDVDGGTAEDTEEEEEQPDDDQEEEEQPNEEEDSSSDTGEASEEGETPPTEPVKPPPGFVPLAAVDAARKKNRALEEELNALRQQYDPAFQVPEVGTPEYARYQQETFQREAINVNLNASERFARKTHGEQLVDDTKEWFESLAANNPKRAAEILTSEDPYDLAITEYKAQKAQEIELEEYRAWVAAGKPTLPPPAPPKKPVKPSEFAARQAAQEEQPAAPRKRAAPPKTLIEAQDAGGAKNNGEGPSGPGVAFRDTFGR